MLHAWDSVQITEDSNKRFQFIKPIWATFHFNGTIYFWEGIIKGWLKPWQCVNLTVFISFKGRQPSFAQACLRGRRRRTKVPHRASTPFPLPVAERQNYLIDFGHVYQTNSAILNTFMSLHALTEFGGGGHKSSGWDWQSCPRSLGPTRLGCKVAVYAATPGREGSADLEIMTLPPLLRFTLTISPHDPISLCPSPCVKSLAVLTCLW